MQALVSNWPSIHIFFTEFFEYVLSAVASEVEMVWVKGVCFQADNLSLIPGTHVVEVEIVL